MRRMVIFALMVRRVLFGSMLSVLLLDAFSLPNARAQMLIDTAHSAIRPDSSTLHTSVIPNGALFSFDHLLSIYEWHGRFEYGAPLAPAVARSSSASIDTVHLEGNSRFLQDNLIRSTSTIDSIYADEPMNGGSIRPMVAFYGSSYATSGLPGFSAATLVPSEADGYGVAGLRYLPLKSDLDFSAAAGIAEQAQSGLSTAAGPIVRGMFYAPSELVSDNTLLSAGAQVDERFFQERDQRYSDDRASISSANPVGGPGTLDSNHAYLDAGLGRRDFFYNSDSNSSPIKQERTELLLSLRDSLNYPVSGKALTATINAALEPSSIMRQSDLPTSELASSSFSAISSLLVPNEISTLRTLIGGRLDLVASSEWSAEGRMSYDEKTENVQLLGNALTGLDPSLVSQFANILNESSYEQRITQAEATVVYQPSQRERFQLETDANLLNYDTPSSLNDDDHDNLVTSALARYDRFFSDELHAWVDLRAARTHLVYLLADRSAQNNVTQSLTLSTHAVYNGSTVFAEADGEVFANYTVLDYLDSVPALQGIGNYVMRGLTLSDSIRTPLGIQPFGPAYPFTIEEGSMLQISERGSYDEPTFSEVLDTRITELSGSLLLGLSGTGGQSPWSVRAGVRGFFLFNDGQNTASLAGGPVFQELERQTRIGPLVIVSLMRWHGVGPMLNGSVWYSVIKDETFDGSSAMPSAITRMPQIESQLSAQWTF